MSIVDNTPVNAATVNAALMSRTTDTDTIGKLALQNTEPASGAAVTNVQRAVNETFDVVGIGGIGDTNAKNYSSNNFVDDGMNRKQAIEAIDVELGVLEITKNAFPVHTHDGTTTPRISASNLLDINQLVSDWQSITRNSVTGTNANINTQMAGKVNGLGGTQVGVITLPPHNRALLFNPVTGDSFEDTDGTKVYGRIEFPALIWTIYFYTNKAGVETPYNFTSSTDLQIFFLEVFNLATRPTVPSMPDFSSLNVTGDVVDATATQRGVVSTSTQTFAGDKTFNNAVSVVGNMTAQNLRDSRVQEWTPVSAASVPSAASGKLNFFVDSSDNLFKQKNQSGAVKSVNEDLSIINAIIFGG